MARPEAEIDLAELEKLAGMQCTNEEIAAFFGVSKRTILRRCQAEKFRDILEQGRAKGRVSVRRCLFKLASAGNVAAGIFLAKNLLGYKDSFSNEHSGPGGVPIAIEARPDFSKLSNEELELLRQLVGKTKPADRN
jgi:hypothetical protein